jgi:hypothetical protein
VDAFVGTIIPFFTMNTKVLQIFSSCDALLSTVGKENTMLFALEVH